MWWNKGGLASGGVECAPVRVFLVPSFLRLYVLVTFCRQGLWNSVALQSLWRSAAGVLLLSIVSCLDVIP